MAAIWSESDEDLKRLLLMSLQKHLKIRLLKIWTILVSCFHRVSYYFNPLIKVCYVSFSFFCSCLALGHSGWSWWKFLLWFFANFCSTFHVSVGLFTCIVLSRCTDKCKLVVICLLSTIFKFKYATQEKQKELYFDTLAIDCQNEASIKHLKRVRFI